MICHKLYKQNLTKHIRHDEEIRRFKNLKYFPSSFLIKLAKVNQLFDNDSGMQYICEISSNLYRPDIDFPLKINHEQLDFALIYMEFMARHAKRNKFLFQRTFYNLEILQNSTSIKGTIRAFPSLKPKVTDTDTCLIC